MRRVLNFAATMSAVMAPLLPTASGGSASAFSPAAAVHPSLKKYVDAERRREVERNARLPGTPAAAGRSSEVEVLTEVDPADTRGTGYHVD